MKERLQNQFKSKCEKFNGRVKEGDARRKRVDDKLTCKLEDGKEIALRTETDLAVMKDGETRAVIHDPETIKGEQMDGYIEIKSEYRDDGIRDKIKLETDWSEE
jgi:hypothetical protein